MKMKSSSHSLFSRKNPILSREEACQLMASNNLDPQLMSEMSRVLISFDTGIYELSNGIKINATKDRLLGGGLISDIGGKLWDFAKNKLVTAGQAAAKAGWNSLIGQEPAANEEGKNKQLAEMEAKFTKLSQEQQQNINAQLEAIKGLIPAASAHADPELDADNALQLNLAAKKLKAVDLPGLTQHISAEMRDMNSNSSIIFKGEFKGQMNSNVQTVTNGNFNFGGLN